MLSVVRYLCENGYSVYICSGSDRDTVRVMLEGTLDQYIPADHVIGTDFLYEASGQGDQAGSAYHMGTDETLIISGCSDERTIKRIPMAAIRGDAFPEGSTGSKMSPVTEYAFIRRYH